MDIDQIMITSHDSPSPPRRRFLHLSVRALMVVVLVLAVGLGWIANRSHPRRVAVAKIREAGGSVKFDYEFANSKPIKGGASPYPNWARKALGDESFHNIVQASLPLAKHDAKESKDLMAALARLDRLETLYISDLPRDGGGLAPLAGLTRMKTLTLARSSYVTDDDLAHLARMDDLEHFFVEWGDPITGRGLAHLATDHPRLVSLNLARSAIADDDLVALAKFPNLELLNLGQTAISDAGLVHLRGLSKLAHLYLPSTRITGAGLASLSGLDHLEELLVGRTGIDDDGLAHLTGLKNLSRLDLSGTPVTDAGLADLAGLTSLQDLNLSGTRITDAGLDHLRGLAKLRKLNADGTQVNEAGASALKAALPGLRSPVLSRLQRAAAPAQPAR